MEIKMKKTLVVSAIGAMSLLLSGCLCAPFEPPVGLVSVIKAPLSTEGNWEMGSKSGESSSISILGLVAVGDCSISTAADAGGVSKVNHVDYEYRNVLGIYQKATVIVYGE